MARQYGGTLTEASSAKQGLQPSAHAAKAGLMDNDALLALARLQARMKGLYPRPEVQQ
jgi:hypothetical protein